VGVLSSIRLDLALALVTALWFVVTGISKIGYSPAGGRRAVAVPTWVVVVRRTRGVLEFIGGLALIGLTVLNFLQYPVPAIGLPLGLALAAFALWTAVESWVPPLRPVRIILSLIGFALAVFFAGFRG
jgi:hypothetical protein